MTTRIYGLCRMNPGLAGEFKRTFHKPLKSYWCVYTGFDLVAFDAMINPPDGVSLRDHLRATYSGSAATLIERLISE